MIDTLFFGLQIFGVVVLIGWAVIHDHLKEDAPTSGPLAYKQADRADGEGSEVQKTDVGLTRRRGRFNLENRRRLVRKSDP